MHSMAAWIGVFWRLHCVDLFFMTLGEARKVSDMHRQRTAKHGQQGDGKHFRQRAGGPGEIAHDKNHDMTFFFSEKQEEKPLRFDV